MSGMNFPDNTLIFMTAGEEAKLFSAAGSKITSIDHWMPQNPDDEGVSGNSWPQPSDTESEDATFSQQVAERLCGRAHKGKFKNLVLIADPDSLGEIRPLLHQDVEEKIILELYKTLINSPMKDIEQTLSRHF